MSLHTSDLVLVPGRQLKPLDNISGFQVRPGFFRFFGATIIPGGVNFTIQSHGATSCELLLFHREAEEPFAALKFPDNYKIGFVYSMIVFGLTGRSGTRALSIRVTLSLIAAARSLASCSICIRETTMAW